MIKQINISTDIIINLIVGFALIVNWIDGYGSIVHLAIGIITIGLGIRIGLNKTMIRDMLFPMNIIKSSQPSSKEV